jgi:O-6-methylguanine DNA methyltransferase
MNSLTEDRVIAGLRALREVSAPDLSGAVLGEIGLADRYAPLDTTLGELYVAHNARGISAVMFAHDDADFERMFRARFGRPAFREPSLPSGLLRAAERQMEGKMGALRFDLRGLSEFEQAVLLKALEIPRGEIRPYSWIAREIGHPRAVRAVGTALARNPIPLFIPCHRVVRLDGTIGNYGLGGSDNKRRILGAEGIDVARVERLARAGTRFIGSDTTHIYCLPTCRHARRVTPTHEHSFHSLQEAESAGYRPCKVCRPA